MSYVDCDVLSRRPIYEKRADVPATIPVVVNPTPPMTLWYMLSAVLNSSRIERDDDAPHPPVPTLSISFHPRDGLFVPCPNTRQVEFSIPEATSRQHTIQMPCIAASAFFGNRRKIFKIISNRVVIYIHQSQTYT
jgi:hypothetical protein